mmetsp:Transcript_47439/g.120339  ORF Transcript_47439/g.120339 Transcript_47439/m.120339 type:complete len:243 (+) Transcript_47439:769-1497(+)
MGLWHRQPLLGELERAVAPGLRGRRVGGRQCGGQRHLWWRRWRRGRGGGRAAGLRRELLLPDLRVERLARGHFCGTHGRQRTRPLPRLPQQPAAARAQRLRRPLVPPRPRLVGRPRLWRIRPRGRLVHDALVARHLPGGAGDRGLAARGLRAAGHRRRVPPRLGPRPRLRLLGLQRPSALGRGVPLHDRPLQQGALPPGTVQGPGQGPVRGRDLQRGQLPGLPRGARRGREPAGRPGLAAAG